MTPERWREVTQIYGAVVSQAPERRSAAVAELCGTDEELRREIESLLQSKDGASLLERAAVDRGSVMQMLTIGSHIGVFRIDSLLGVGGMGEVYRARDTKLNRDVAIKILPPAFANDPDRLARFKREAQVLASLNHPNVGGIHGFEDEGGVRALVLELVEGPTLAELLGSGSGARASGRAGLPIDEALVIARQIADALEAAHEQGIVHRDLKPANIKVRDDGTVKVLDFGLAKMAEADGAGGAGTAGAPGLNTQSPTITTPAMTAAGMILGTAAYMSPEQAKGRPADKRSDIWAFGCVLYEMLTGKRAFDGEDVSETLAAILRAEPDWSALPTLTPSSVRRLLARSLQKDRRSRLADIADARFEITDALQDTATAGPVSTPVPQSNVRIRLTWAGAAAAIAVATTVVTMRVGAPIPAGSVKFEILPPVGWSRPFDNSMGPAAVTSIAISPDGRTLAFLARNDAGRSALWIRAIDQLSSRLLPGTEDAIGPFWAPDSRQIAFFAAGKLKKVDITGAAPQTICVTPTFNSGTWGTRDVIVFSLIAGRSGAGLPERALLQVPAAGGVPTPAQAGDDKDAGVRPAFLPDGRHFVYRSADPATNGNTWVGSLDSADRTLLFKDTPTGNVVFANGRLLYMNGTTLFAQRFDLDRLKLTGPAIPVAEQVETSGLIPPVGVFSASTTGTLVYRTGPGAVGGQLTILDRGGNVLGAKGDRGDYSDVEMAPDGKRAALSVRDPNTGLRDLWLVDLEQGTRLRFTLSSAAALRSAWSPDGSQVVFSRDQNRMDLFIKRVNGSGTAEEPLLANDDFSRALERTALGWSKEGAILFERGGRFSAGSIITGTAIPTEFWTVRAGGDRKPVPFLQRPFSVSQGRFSPDGHWVAYTSLETGVPEIMVTPFPGPGDQRRVSVVGGTQPRWRSDGKELFFIYNDSLLAVDVQSTASGIELGSPRNLFKLSVQNGPFVAPYDVFPDGQRFLVNMLDTSAQLTASPIAVVLNWTAGLP